MPMFFPPLVASPWEDVNFHKLLVQLEPSIQDQPVEFPTNNSYGKKDLLFFMFL